MPRFRTLWRCIFFCAVLAFSTTGRLARTPAQRPTCRPPAARPKSSRRKYADYVSAQNAKDAVTVVRYRYGEGAVQGRGGGQEGDAACCEINTRPYKAQLEAAQAAVAQDAAKPSPRIQGVRSETEGRGRKQELDQYQAQEDQAIANLKSPRPTLISANLKKLKWTKIYSPIDGVVGRYYLTQGNLVA